MNSYELYKKKLDELYGKSNKIETNEKTISSKDLSWWEQFGAGFERIRNNIVQGALDLGEGIIDTGAGALAFGASVFGNPVMEKEIEKFIKTDYTKSIMESDFGDFMGNVTGDWMFGKKAKELAISQERFLPEVMGVSLDDIATGVGNALGTAGLALIPGVGQMAVFGAFSGTGIEEALNQGATINEAMAYGALNGATEMITEKVMGDVLGLAGLGLNKAFGVGASKALTKGGASAVKNIFKGMTEEGLEEVVSELVNPIWQMLTYKSETEGNFLEKYSKIFEENGGMKGVIESFIAGGLTGGVFEGVGTVKGITRYGSLQNYNLELETQQLYEINRNLENALAEGDEKKYKKYQNQKQAVISRSLTKFENLLNQLQYESNGGNEKRLENKRNLANAFADESLSKPELELAKKILGKNVDVEITGSKDSETQVQNAIVKLSKGQISVKDYVKTILHEGGHLVDAGKGKFVETILNGMSDETYKEMWETLEPKYKKEIMQSNMLKREMNNNPGLTTEEAYERIKKKYLDEEIAVEYFGTMFKNSKEFMNDIKAYTSKGLKALKEKFRLFFRGKAKPDNYKELLEMFDKGIKEADERAVKRLEAERKKEREKRIKEIEESLPTDEEDVKYRKKGESYAKTNDFRELQETNRRMAINEIEAFHRGDKIVDERIRNRLSRILREQLESSSSMFGYDDGVLTNPINNTNIKIYKNVNAYEFHDIFELVKTYLYNGDLVDIHDVQSNEWSTGYEDCTCYLMENGLSGFAITKNGDLISVFNLGWKGFLRTIKNYIRTEGAKTLDCYNSKTQPLPQMYEKTLGFKTASILDFNYDILLESKGKKYADYFVEIYGESPVHFMVLTDENIKMKTFDKDQYDEAYDYQQEIANPTEDEDIRKRITKDSEGNSLTQEQEEYFEDSMVRDENGNLLVVYHGSNYKFTVFDPNDSTANYKFGGKVVNFFSNDFEMSNTYVRQIRVEDKIVRPGEFNPYNFSYDDDLDYGGGGVYKVYLNIKNPYIVDAKGKPWNAISHFSKDKNFEKNYNNLMSEATKIYENILEDTPTIWDSSVVRSFSNKFGKDEFGYQLAGYFNPIIDYENGKGTIDISKEINRKKLKQATIVFLLTGKTTAVKLNYAKQLLDDLMNDIDKHLSDSHLGTTNYEPNSISASELEELEKIISSNGFELIFSPYDSTITIRLELTLKFKLGMFVLPDIYFEINQNKSLKENLISNIKKISPATTTNDIVQNVINSNEFEGTDYDGVIIKNVYDYAEYAENEKPNDIFITIKDSNQIKSIYNKNPTEDEDIRYRRTENQEEYYEDLLNEDAELAKVVKRLESILEKYEDTETPVPRSKKALEYLEKLRSQNEILIGYYEDLVDDLNNAIESKNKAEFTKVLAELKVLTETIQNLQNQVDDWVYNVDTTGDYDNEVPASAESGFEDRIATADEISDEIYDSFSDVEIDLEEYDEEFIKTTFVAEPLPPKIRDRQLERVKPYSTADGYQEIVDRINNATKDEFNQISSEVTAFVNKNKPKTAEEIAQEKLRDKITEARNLISEVEPLIESVNYTPENSKATIQDVKDKGKAIISSLEASIDMSLEEKIDNNLERLNKFKEMVSKFIKEDTQQETEVVEKPVEQKVVEEPTKPVDKANIEELAKPIHKKYRYIESVKNLKDSLKHADGIRKLSTANEKKALIKNEIKNIKELLGKEYVKELMDIGMSEQEARNYAEDKITFFLEGEGDYKGLQSYLDEINEQIKYIEQFTPAGDENVEKAITPKQNKTKVEIKEVVKVVRDSRTNVRKQPTPSAQTVNLYADFVTDPDARVYAQKRGVELLQVLVDELDKGLIGKNNKPRLFFKNGREFVINKIHMILNKFSNAQYTKGGEDFFDYSNLTTEEQIDLIVKEVMTGVQLLTKVYEIDETTGNPISDGEMQYAYIGVYNPHYQKLVKFLTTQLENIIENEGSIPKAVELIDNATEGFKKEIENKIISDYEAQTLAYSTAVQELRREIELLNKALVDAQNDKEPNLKAIEKLQEQLASKNETLLKIKEKLEGRIAKLSEDRKALKGLLTETLANTRSLEKDVEKAQKTISKLKTKLETKTREAKELKELADNTARKVKKLQQLETKYANQVIVKMSQLERGRELPNDMNNVLTEVGRLINPEFEINSKLSIEIAKLLLKKEYHEAFNLMINAVYDSNFEVEDGFVDYHELVDMFNVDETNEFLASMNEMEQWFNEFVATGKVTKVEKLYRKIERITNAYQVIKDKYNEKRAEMAVYRASRNAVGTTQRINRRLKKLKSEKRFGGLTEYQGLVDWLFESYDKIKGLKLKEIQNGDYRTIADEILNAYNKIKNDLPLDLQMDEQIYIQAQNFITGGINGKNVKAYVKFLNQLNRYAKDITGQALYTIDGVSKTRREWATEIYDNLNDTVGSGKVKWNGLLNYTLDPRVVFKALSGMDENKPVYKLYKMLNEAEINYQRIMIDLGQNIRDFYKNNKKFMKELRSKKTVNIGGYTATRSQFLSLYKLIQREQAKAHLINSSGGINLNGEIIRGWTEEKIEQLENDIKQFFDLDNENSVYKQYIDLTTEFFDNAKKLKVSTDMELMGYTNVEEGEYFPIQITEEDLYSNLDKHILQDKGIVGALDMSFNKDVSSSSKAMKVGDIDDIMNRHMRQMATYSAYAIPIHTFNKIYNYRFSLSGEESKGALNGVNSLMINKAEGFEKFIKNLFMDIQGINPNRTADENVISKAFGWARGNFAKFQLGANLKVIFTQVSALGNALKYIKLKNVIRGIGSRLHIDSGKYALPTVGVYRNMTNTISTAQMQKENQGSFWTQGIEWADQKCIRAIWRACLLQTGMDVEKATEMFNKTVQETQPNYTPLQRSAMMRSKSEVMKALTMFGNQPSKNFSNIVEAVMTISYKKKNGIKITSEDINFVRKTVFESVLWSSAIYSIMSVIFSHLTNNDWDDEPEEYASELFERLVNDAVIGNIPLVGNTIDIDFEKGFVWNEFDMSNSLGIVNDTVSALQDALNGNATPKQMIETIGKAFGIPTANVYKYVMTFVQWIAPQYATQVELMYKGIDLTTTQAVKNTQNHKTKNYYYAYTTNTVSLNQKTMDELYRLYQKDDNVILKAIPKSITFDGESMIIKRSDFKAYYNKMTPVLESVVSDYAYQKLTDEQKALVIKNLINKYHSMSKKQFTESDMNSLEYLMSSGYNNLSKDLIYLGQIKQLENKQEIQKFINKLPLKASQKYLLYYLSGYSINDNQKDMVMAYLKAKGVNPKQANTFFDI